MFQMSCVWSQYQPKKPFALRRVSNKMAAFSCSFPNYTFILINSPPRIVQHLSECHISFLYAPHHHYCWPIHLVIPPTSETDRKTFHMTGSMSNRGVNYFYPINYHTVSAVNHCRSVDRKKVIITTGVMASDELNHVTFDI